MQIKNYFNALVLFAFTITSTLLPDTTFAAIIDSRTYNSLEILLDNDKVVDARDSDAGSRLASVSIYGPISMVSAHSKIWIDVFSPDNFRLNFDLGFSGRNSNYDEGFYVGIADGVSGGEIDYFAKANSSITVNWLFEYSGDNPFGLQYVHFISDTSDYLGNMGFEGLYEGKRVYTSNQDRYYSFFVLFTPNIGAYPRDVDGVLQGYFDFSVKQTYALPEKSSLILLLIGFIFIAIRKRRTNGVNP